MEKNIQINTNDNHLIYGVLNTSEKDDKLIIFVHGLTGHKNMHQFYNASKFFPKKGFSTFCFDLYSGEKNGRILSNCTIETHSSDLNKVINYFKDNYKEIHLVGHSLGGPTILFSDVSLVSSIVLWDPSFDALKNLSSVMEFNKNINKYIVKWGVEYLLSPEMIEGWKNLGDNLIDHFIKPTNIICAGKGVLYKDWKEKINLIKIPSELFLIEEAGHCFDEKDTESILFAETLKWFQTQSS